jgi:uncharacterized membrane protein
MESWILYGLVAAVLIACRDMFTKSCMKKYTPTEHILYYYVLCGVFIVGYALYKRNYTKEGVRCIELSDVWKYALVALLSVAVIAPCEVISIKKCRNPGQSKAIINLNSIFVFFLALIFLKDSFSLKKLIGIMLTVLGIYLVI